MRKEHTPGPWHKNERRGPSGFGIWIPSFEIATVSSEEDARLIAAAPELLKALKMLIEDYYDDHSDHVECGVLSARAAIARAIEGK